jgi:hypothetical protein
MRPKSTHPVSSARRSSLSGTCLGAPPRRRLRRPKKSRTDNRASGRPAGLPPAGHARCASGYFAIALFHTSWVQASAPGSFLITGALPPESSTFTVRW